MKPHAAFDTDHSGKIEFTEFLIAFNIRSKGTLDEKLNWTFDVYDHNNDGIIDRTELKKMFNLLFRMMEVDMKDERYDVNKRVDAMLMKHDASGDKVLDRQEFIEGIKKDVHLKKLLIDHKLIS